MSTGERDACRRLLAAYAEPAPAGTGSERRFGATLAASVAVCALLGWAALGVEPPVAIATARDAARRATFVLQPPAPPVLPPPAPVDPPAADLTAAPLLAQPLDAPAHESEPREQPAPAEAAAPPAPEPPRQVYGLRRVYARGLGTAGDPGATIVAKRGNTLAVAPDSLIATPADLAGEIAALSTVTRAPELLDPVRPDYTAEMIAERVEGLLQARLLVDADGAVKAVEMSDDLGHGSREAALAALWKLRFRPALKGDRPVAAWILMKVRFVLQD